VINCLCVHFNGFSVLEGYFGHFVSKGKLVIMVRIIFNVSSENHYFIKLLVGCSNLFYNR